MFVHKNNSQAFLEKEGNTLDFQPVWGTLIMITIMGVWNGEKIHVSCWSSEIQLSSKGPREISVDVTVLLTYYAFIFIAHPRCVHICVLSIRRGPPSINRNIYRRNMRIEKDGIHFHSLLEIKLPSWSMEFRMLVSSDGYESFRTMICSSDVVRNQ